jgi:hypothetical protein
MQENINYKISNNYTFRFGKYLKESIAIYKKEAALFLAFSMFYAIASAVLPLVIFFGGLANNFFISPVLAAGYFFVVHKVSNQEKVQFKDFFGGFKTLKSLALINLSLLIFMIFAALTTCFLLSQSESLTSLPQELINMSNSVRSFKDLPIKPILIVVSLLILVPSVIFAAYILSVPFLIFEKVDFWTAMKTSRAIALKKIFYLSIIVLFAGLFYYTIEYGLVISLNLGFNQVNTEDILSLEQAQSNAETVLPIIKRIGKFVLFQAISKAIIFPLLPLYYGFIYAFYKDLTSQNDILEEEN